MTYGRAPKRVSMVGRTYLERGVPVVVEIQWGLKSRGETYGGPRNVLIRRPDGTRVVRPFRGLLSSRRRAGETAISPAS